MEEEKEVARGWMGTGGREGGRAGGRARRRDEGAHFCLSVERLANFSAIPRSSDVDMKEVSTPPMTPYSSGVKKLEGSTPPETPR